MKDKDRFNLTWGVILGLGIVILVFAIIYAVRNTSSVATSRDLDSTGCYTPENVRKHYGETGCVDYNVGYTYRTAAGTKFLDQLRNYSSGFVGYIPRNSGASGINLNDYQNKNIKVSGKIQEYSGYPEIEINELSQVQVYN